MKIMIFSGGMIETDFALGFVKQVNPDKIVAADRGLEFCYDQGITPDCIVGDFDSIRPGVLEHYREKDVRILTFVPEKDMTDTDIAVKEAARMGADEIYLLGTTGTRLDHVISNLFNLVLLWEQGIRGYVADSHNLITVPLGNHHEMRKADAFGPYVSLFPLRGPVQGLTLKGFKYPLEKATIFQGDGGLTTSNEVLDDRAFISWEEGILMVMESRD